jgi:hypothetical protein
VSRFRVKAREWGEAMSQPTLTRQTSKKNKKISIKTTALQNIVKNT